MTLTRSAFLTLLALNLGGLAQAQAAPLPTPSEYDAFYADVATLAAQLPGPVLVEEGFTAPPRRPLSPDRDPRRDTSLLPSEVAEQTIERTWGYRVRKLRGVTVLQKRYDLPADPPFITLAEWERFDAHLRQLMSRFGADAAPKDMAALSHKVSTAFTEEQYEPLAKGMGLWELTPEQQELVKRYATANYVACYAGYLPSTKDWLHEVLTGTAKAALLTPSNYVEITFADGSGTGFYPQNHEEGTPETKSVPMLAPFATPDVVRPACRVSAGAFLQSLPQGAVQLHEGTDQHLITVLNGDKMTPNAFAAGLCLLYDLRMDKATNAISVRTRRSSSLNHLREFRQFSHQMLPLRLRRFLHVEALYKDPRDLPEGQTEAFEERCQRMLANAIYRFGALESAPKANAYVRKQVLATIVALWNIRSFCGSYFGDNAPYFWDWERLGIRVTRSDTGEIQGLSWEYPFPPPPPEEEVVSDSPR